MNKLKSPFKEIIQKCHRPILATIVFGLAINILMLFVPLYTMQVLDRVLSSGSIETLVMLTIISISAFLCLSILDSCRQNTLANIGDWVEAELSPMVLKKNIELAVLNPSVSSGDMLRDVQTIRSFISGPAAITIMDAPWSIVYIIITFMINTPAGFICILGICGLLAFAFWNEKSTQPLVKKAIEMRISGNQAMDMASRNSEVMEAMGMSDHVISSWISDNINLRKTQMLAYVRSFRIGAATKFMRMVMQISTIGIGAAMAIKSRETAGSIIAASILVGRSLAPFESALGIYKQITATKSSMERLHNLIEKAPAREESIELPTPIGRIEFDKVIFVPPGGKIPTLRGVSFSVEPGQVVGIIGPSASGKSTLLKLLTGVWKPAAGFVRIDGAETHRWRRSAFADHMGYLPQDIELFKATIKENIARMRRGISDKLVIEAAKASGAHEMILSLTKGYETELGVGGTSLSGGQKQRIGLARAFCGDIKILALDEPNASLDAAGELSLDNALRLAKSKNMTVFVTTHKISLLSKVDMILVMREGNVIAYGPRDDVLKRMKISSPEDIGNLTRGTNKRVVEGNDTANKRKVSNHQSENKKTEDKTNKKSENEQKSTSEKKPTIRRKADIEED